jgi:hypothetical protein
MAWKATDARGYVRVYGLRGGWEYEHRLIAEAKLGRLLRRGEVVHHRNEIRSDNRSDNLDVLKAGRHVALHNHRNPKRRALSAAGGAKGIHK